MDAKEKAKETMKLLEVLKDEPVMYRRVKENSEERRIARNRRRNFRKKVRRA